jgi:FKBP-type peptidyl-prolyl cis-trans isomerase FkpA
MLFICRNLKIIETMKRILAASVITLFIFSSCLKKDSKCGYSDSTIVAPDAEKQALSDSLDKYNITNATLHNSGFYYTIINPGTGPSVSNLCSNITVSYKGEFFDGRIFDSTKTGETAYFPLGGVITGWQKGIPLLKAGGEINLYIPPSLGYGAVDVTDPRTQAVVIPKNSYLVFKVHVVDIQ